MAVDVKSLRIGSHVEYVKNTNREDSCYVMNIHLRESSIKQCLTINN